MPWKHNSTILKPGKAWRDTNGTLHSALWLRYPDADKTKYNIVWENPPASEEPFDNRFYSGRETDGTLIPRSLTDTLWVDADGKAVTDPITGEQGKTLGLKSVAIEVTKKEAGDKLARYDWYVIRKLEKSTAIPSSVSTYRDAVRTACNAIETSIGNASDLAAFIALYNEPVDSDGNPTGNPPIFDWPDAI